MDTMAEAFPGDRKRILEEEFFQKQERSLLERMRTEHATQTAREALSHASGVTDTAVLDRLIGLGLQAATLAAMGLVPLVAVAWADGALDARERQAVVSALETAGFTPDSPAGQLLQSWLTSAPPASLLEAWKAYMAALCPQLSTADRISLRDRMLARARAVAEASGGFLGLGAKVSPAEEAMLRTLAEAYADTGSQQNEGS
jgi:hypothetical protein